MKEDLIEKRNELIKLNEIKKSNEVRIEVLDRENMVLRKSKARKAGKYEEKKQDIINIKNSIISIKELKKRGIKSTIFLISILISSFVPFCFIASIPKTILLILAAFLFFYMPILPFVIKDCFKDYLKTKRYIKNNEIQKVEESMSLLKRSMEKDNIQVEGNKVEIERLNLENKKIILKIQELLLELIKDEEVKNEYIRFISDNLDEVIGENNKQFKKLK